jgi:Holliday junction resolvase
VKRYGNRRDKIERDIIKALKKVGCTVQQLNGEDIPDLLVGRARKNYLLEVKNPVTGKLSPGQQEWHEWWDGQVIDVWGVDDALRAVGVLR